MGLFLQNQGPRSELQTKVAADLQARLKDQKPIEAAKTESAFTENTTKTRKAGVWIALLLILSIIVATIAVSIN